MKLETYLKRHKYSVFRVRNEEEDRFYSGKILLDEINNRDGHHALVPVGREVTTEYLDSGIAVLDVSNEILIVEGTWARATDIYLAINSLEE